jgi:carboxyl-terminal processing protease
LEIVANAMLTAVPGRPQFVPPGQILSFEQLGNNRYVGTGIQVRMHEKEELVQILIPFPGGPARKAGAKAGDLIVAVNGADMKGKRLTDVIDCLRGDEGTKVSIVVRQPDEKTTRTLDMVRSVIPFESAVGCRRVGEEAWEFRLDASEPIAYVRFLNVSSSTPIELTKLEPRLREEGVKAVVLDLRSARAAQFQPLTLVADALLDGGVMWKVRDSGNRVKEYKADRDCVFRGWPLVVLVDANTDPMMTLLAAALQDAKRAVIVGESPQESGWVTSLVKLGDGKGGLILRTGLVERPESALRSQKPIRLADALAGGWVLQPDHEVALPRPQKEAILEHQAAQDRVQIDTNKKPPEDAQLAKALAVLREALKK